MMDFINFVDKYKLDRTLSIKNDNNFEKIEQYIISLSHIGCRCELKGTDKNNFSLHISECEFRHVIIHAIDIIVEDSILLYMGDSIYNNKELSITFKQIYTLNTYDLLTDINSIQKQLETVHKITRIIASLYSVVEYLYKNKTEI